MKKTIMNIIILAALLLMAACQTTATPTAVEPVAQPVTLELVGGTETKILTLDELKKLPATEGQAGIKSSTGKITPPALFKGVLLADLLALMGAGDDMAVQVEAKDGYAMTLSMDQIKSGNFIAYDPGTGEETKNAGALRALVAYEMDGKALDIEQDGALRLVIIGEKNNQVTDGHWSVKWVRKISVKPMVQEWTLHLEGALTEEMDRGTFESGANEKCHKALFTDSKAQEWQGIPLWLLVGRVDDDVKHDDGAYNDELADKGYTIEVVAADGYSVTFESARVKRNDNLIVAFLVNGNPLTDKDFPLKLVGSDVQKKEGVGAIAKIIVHFEAEAVVPTATTAPTQPPAAVGGALAITGKVGTEQSWTLDQLHAMDVVTLKVTHPKKGDQEATGVRINALLDLAALPADATTVVITADDGFTAEVSLADVRACADCLIAFNESNGLKSVMPGMESNFWVKGVVKLEIK